MLHKIIPGRYRVVRDCCTSGNCIECNGKTPVGTPLRVVQFAAVSKECAEDIAQRWAAYKPTVEEGTSYDMTGADKVQEPERFDGMS